MAEPILLREAMSAQYRKLKKKEKWNQIANAISFRSNQDQVLWSMFTIFWGANTILLVVLFSTGKLPTEPLVSNVVSIVGTLLSVIWHIMQGRILKHIERFERIIKCLEDDLKVSPEYAVSRKDSKSITRQLIKFCSLGGAIVWFTSFILFVSH